jgi:DNA-binding response OmpR family regulator
MSKQALTGCRILVLEDDYYQAYDATEILKNAGAMIIGCRARSLDLSELQALGSIDIALLDINLGGNHSFGFARLLQSRRTPCVFVTGYDADVVPSDLSGVPVLTKPVDEALVLAAIRALWKEAPTMGGGTEDHVQH